MNLAEFYALQAIMDTDQSAADAVGRIVALVPATASRLSLTIDSLWAMDASEVMPMLTATIPTLMTADKAAQLSIAAESMREAFSAGAIAKLFGDAG